MDGKKPNQLLRFFLTAAVLLAAIAIPATPVWAADYSITAASVVQGSDAKTREGTAGATIAAGDVLYIDTGDENKLKLADANGASPLYTVAGIALHGAAAGQPIKYQYEGDITFNAAFTKADVVVLSGTAGKMAPVADIATGWFVTVIGVAKSTTVVTLKFVTAGVEK